MDRAYSLAPGKVPVFSAMPGYPAFIRAAVAVAVSIPPPRKKTQKKEARSWERAS
jgi:hypothetical protein